MLLRPFKSRYCGRTLMIFADSADAQIANARTTTAVKFCQRTAATLVRRLTDDNWVVCISIRTSTERDCAESQSQESNQAVDCNGENQMRSDYEHSCGWALPQPRSVEVTPALHLHTIRHPPRGL